MRIGIDIKAFKNGTTGIARYLMNIMDCLQTMDSENDYFLFECTPSSYNPANPRWKKILVRWKLPGILWQQFVLPFHLQKHAIDVLWAPEQICPVFFMGKIKIITTVHDCTAIRYPRTCKRSNYLIQKYFMPLTILKSRSLLPVSGFVKRELEQLFPQYLGQTSMTIVDNGRPEWTIQEGYTAAQRKNFLFFAGNIEPRKNLIRLVEALELLFAQGVTLPLWIAGPRGWKNKDFYSRLQKSVVSPHIKFLGFLMEDQLKEHYLACKAFVYPSLYEGFGLPVLEALSLDCLILTSRGTVMEEIAGSCAIYFNSDDARDIADKIKEVYTPGFRREKYLAGKNAVLKRYSWQASAEKVKLLFHGMPEKTST